MRPPACSPGTRRESCLRWSRGLSSFDGQEEGSGACGWVLLEDENWMEDEKEEKEE